MKEEYIDIWKVVGICITKGTKSHLSMQTHYFFDGYGFEIVTPPREILTAHRPSETGSSFWVRVLPPGRCDTNTDNSLQTPI
jgi:hypothetical protein